MTNQSFLAMTPTQYTTLTGLVSPCSVSQGILCLDEGYPTNEGTIKLYALLGSLEQAQEVATKLNNQLF